MKPTAFSILTPVYNVEKFLPECIESVLAQTFTDWELILVDDGSPDNSGQICDEYAAKYPSKIKVFHNENHGLVYTRRYALTKATGFYYVILDSDDALTSDALQIIYDTFQKYNCDCVIYEVECVTSPTKYVQQKKSTEFSPLVADKYTLYRKVFLHNRYNPLWRKAIRAEIITVQDYSKYYHIKYAEDLLQSLEILHNCQKAVFIPDKLYLYRQNPSSMMHSIHTKPLNISFEVREKVLEFLEREQVFSEEDMEAYHGYCIRLFEGEIKNICCNVAPLTEKVKLLRSVKEEAYYKDFLASKQYKQPIRPIYTQFRLGLYWLLIMEIKIYTFMMEKLKCLICH